MEIWQMTLTGMILIMVGCMIIMYQRSDKE
jgi:hypothetical protein